MSPWLPSFVWWCGGVALVGSAGQKWVGGYILFHQTREVGGGIHTVSSNERSGLGDTYRFVK
jgi:hypothetical protein